MSEKFLMVFLSTLFLAPFAGNAATYNCYLLGNTKPVGQIEGYDKGFQDLGQQKVK